MNDDRELDRDPAADLNARLAQLPKDVAPPENGWSRIEARLESGTASIATAGWSGFGPWSSLAMAASIAALAVMIVLSTDRGEAPEVAVSPVPTVSGPGSSARMAPAASMPQVMPASLGGDAAMGEAFNATRVALREDFGRRVEQLDPRSRELVLANMKVIDDALARISTALKAHPQSAVLQDLLITTYQKELAYMGRMTLSGSRDSSRISL